MPLEEAYALWEDRERIPNWMPWITSVKVRSANHGTGSAEHGALETLCLATGSSLSAPPLLAPWPAPPASACCLLQVQPDDPRLSRWTLSTFQFNRQWEFSWMALNMTPLRNQKIHWRSVPGSVGGSLGSALEVQNRWETGGQQACAREALCAPALMQDDGLLC